MANSGFISKNCSILFIFRCSLLPRRLPTSNANPFAPKKWATPTKVPFLHCGLAKLLHIVEPRHVGAVHPWGRAAGEVAYILTPLFLDTNSIFSLIFVVWEIGFFDIFSWEKRKTEKELKNWTKNYNFHEPTNDQQGIFRQNRRKPEEFFKTLQIPYYWRPSKNFLSSTLVCNALRHWKFSYIQYSQRNFWFNSIKMV